MRDAFREITQGWTFDAFHALTARINKLAEWTKNHGPLLPDEEATVKKMIQTQIAIGDE
jgi:hypothetical protein